MTRNLNRVQPDLYGQLVKHFPTRETPKVGGPFMTCIKEYLKELNMQSLPLTPFKGNRFNIVFHNAWVVYFFHNKMKEFLEDHLSNNWVLYDLKISFFIAGCKALGLVCKLITTPLWHLIERKDLHIMDMNNFYLQLTNYLKDSVNNIDDFMAGRLLPFGGDTYLKQDKIFESLVTSSEHDYDVCIILSVILPAMAKLTQNHFRDHLPGGLYKNPSDELRDITRSVEKHNKYSEFNFAYLDHLLRFKPHLTTLSAEAYLMFAHNKTKKWLETKDPNEMAQV